MTTTHQFSPELVQDFLDWTKDKVVLYPASESSLLVENVRDGSFLSLEVNG